MSLSCCLQGQRQGVSEELLLGAGFPASWQPHCHEKQLAETIPEPQCDYCSLVSRYLLGCGTKHFAARTQTVLVLRALSHCCAVEQHFCALIQLLLHQFCVLPFPSPSLLLFWAAIVPSLSYPSDALQGPDHLGVGSGYLLIILMRRDLLHLDVP